MLQQEEDGESLSAMAHSDDEAGYSKPRRRHPDRSDLQYYSTKDLDKIAQFNSHYKKL